MASHLLCGLTTCCPALCGEGKNRTIRIRTIENENTQTRGTDFSDHVKNYEMDMMDGKFGKSRQSVALITYYCYFVRKFGTKFLSVFY